MQIIFAHAYETVDIVNFVILSTSLNLAIALMRLEFFPIVRIQVIIIVSEVVALLGNRIVLQREAANNAFFTRKKNPTKTHLAAVEHQHQPPKHSA